MILCFTHHQYCLVHFFSLLSPILFPFLSLSKLFVIGLSLKAQETKKIRLLMGSNVGHKSCRPLTLVWQHRVQQSSVSTPVFLIGATTSIPHPPPPWRCCPPGDERSCVYLESSFDVSHLPARKGRSAIYPRKTNTATSTCRVGHVVTNSTSLTLSAIHSS